MLRLLGVVRQRVGYGLEVAVHRRALLTSEIGGGPEEVGCQGQEVARGRRAFDGEEPGPAHPFIVALRTANNQEALISEQGTMIGQLLGEDEIIRGVLERPGPPVEWNEEGTVCI